MEELVIQKDGKFNYREMKRLQHKVNEIIKIINEQGLDKSMTYAVGKELAKKDNVSITPVEVPPVPKEVYEKDIKDNKIVGKASSINEEN